MAQMAPLNNSSTSHSPAVGVLHQVQEGPCVKPNQTMKSPPISTLPQLGAGTCEER